MAKHKIDQAREERIEIEIVVDCYNESERYSAWICYLEDKLEFPFRARCVAKIFTTQKWRKGGNSEHA